jgi:dCMP deaminase
MSDRPGWEQYYMGIAFAVRRRANCAGTKVGAVIVVRNRIVATGYNGTPEGIPNCLEGGCERCAHPDRYPSGEGYDVCICVHAEENALAQAARIGIPVEGGAIYTTLKPCFGCMKALHQAGVRELYYHGEWGYDRESGLQRQYQLLLGRFSRIVRVDMADPDDASWVYPRRASRA